MEKLLNKSDPLNKRDKVRLDPIDLEKDILPLLQSYFRPEFLNRLDDIVLFNPVNAEMLTQIVEIQLDKIIQMIKSEKNIDLIVSSKAKEHIAKV